MRYFFLFSLFILVKTQVNAQSPQGELHGNLQVDAQYYQEDSIIGAVVPNERLASNAFANLIYTKGEFSAGLRYESYLPALQGFSPQYDGVGIPFRYASLNEEQFSITVGNFYEQFGSGLVFRSYEERGLGYDNAMDGVQLRYTPVHNLIVKGVIGKQRKYFAKGEGVVRGLDGELILNDWLDTLGISKLNVSIGGSFVSKYQSDQSSIYNLPENVASFAGRTTISGSKFRIYSEYAYKINDPSANNEFIYKPGTAFITQLSYFQRGFGLSVDLKRIDNMSYRSEREATLADVLINYIPSFTRQHTYNLLATLYPYATQLNGEMAAQAEMGFKLKRNSLLGGKYGTNVLINFSVVHGLDTTIVNDSQTDRTGYTASLTGLGEKYFQDFNVEVTKKWSKKIKTILTYANITYNKDVIEGKTGYGLVHANIAIADISYKLQSKHTLRTEVQSLFTKQDASNKLRPLRAYKF